MKIFHYINCLWIAFVCLGSTILPSNLFAVIPMRHEYSMKVDKNGNAISVWEESLGAGIHRILGSTLDHKASTWSEPVVISKSGKDSRFPVLAMDKNGNGIVVFTVSDSTLGINKLYASQLVSGKWKKPAKISTDSENVIPPYQLEFIDDHATVFWHSFVLPLNQYHLFSRHVKFSHSWDSIRQTTAP